MRNVLASLILLLSFATAHAQTPSISELPPLSGTAIGSGYSATNGPLFIPPSTSLQNLTFPFTISFDMILPTVPTSTAVFASTGTSSPGTGFIIEYNPATSSDLYHSSAQIRPASQFTTSACTTGKMCWRGQLDNTRHHYCYVFTASHAWYYLDGIARDETTSVGSYTPSTTLWELLSNTPANTTMFDFRAYNKALTPDDCVYISRLNQANLISNSGDTNTNLLVSLPLNCTVSGLEYTCADASGNSNNATNAKTPPVLVVTSPCTTSCTVMGTTVTMQSTCTDVSTTLCTEVCYLVDNVQVSSVCPTTAPFTYTWNSQNMIDGVHTLTAVGFNISGAIGTSAGVAMTTANGISAKTVWVNSSSGSDSNDCLAATTGGGHGPCQTFAHITSAITFLGGDTFNVIGTFTNTAAFQLCGPLTGCSRQNFYPSAATLTMTTTGGTCNVMTETTTGCAVLNMSGAHDGIDIVNGANVTIQNVAVVGPATVPLNNYGIYVLSTLPSYISSTGITINNTWTSNFGYNIFLGGSSGYVTGYTLSDNYSTSTPVHVNPGPLTCIRADAGTQGTIQANLATQCGGQSGNNGNGILIFNYPSPPGASNSLMQFNVVHDFGWNDAPNQGGPVGVYVINATNTLIQFNESYNGIPNTTGGIDFDCFDIDDGVTNVTEQYNYAHNCPNQAGFNIVTNPFVTNPNWSNNIVRFNIAENNANCLNVFGDQIGFSNSYIYNNTCSSNHNNSGGFSNPVCWNLPSAIDFFGNNLCIYTGTATNNVSYINFAYNSLPLTNVKISNNDYFAPNTAVSPSWVYNKLNNAPTIFSTLLSYQTQAAQDGNALDANSLNVNPQLVGTPGTGGTCYTDGSGTPPAGPQPCPAAYKLSGSSPLINAGVNVSTLPRTPPANPSVDYFGRPVGPTNFSIGASSGQ
jgi:hypothetical protein